MALTGPLSDERVDAAWIRAHLDDPDLRIIELDVSPAAYKGGHIPGAILWNTYVDMRHPDYLTIGADELQELFRRSGIGPDTTVVVYGYASHLGFWLLKSVGHERVLLMEGPREQWQAAGGAWSVDVPSPPRTDYTLPAQPAAWLASVDEVSQMIGRPEAVILDTRSDLEYRGERFWPSGAPEPTGITGHVPGALHLPVDAFRAPHGGLRSTDELREVMQATGIDPNSPMVAYCTIGNRASMVWYGLSVLLGYPDVKVYYGSWAEWGKAGRPVE